MAQAKKAIAKTGGKAAARNAARASVKTYHNYIDGEWVASQSGEMFENINPADNRDVVGMLSIAGATPPLPDARNCSFASARS